MYSCRHIIFLYYIHILLECKSPAGGQLYFILFVEVKSILITIVEIFYLFIRFILKSRSTIILPTIAYLLHRNCLKLHFIQVFYMKMRSHSFSRGQYFCQRVYIKLNLRVMYGDGMVDGGIYIYSIVVVAKNYVAPAVRTIILFLRKPLNLSHSFYILLKFTIFY